MPARVAARAFHWRDCPRYGSELEDHCLVELTAGQQAELGQVSRGDYLADLWRHQTEFVGNRSDWRTWRRQPRASTAAAVDADSPEECRHFVPAAEYCPDCSETPDVDELNGYELMDHQPPEQVLLVAPPPVTLW